MTKGEKLIQLREVRKEDREMLWKWANDPDVRQASFSSAIISWENHIDWFTKKLNDPTCQIFIALNLQNTLIGQVRFDLQSNQEAVISISIDKNCRGFGYGIELIDRGIEKISTSKLTKTIHAFIKPENIPSRKLFESAKFKNIGTEVFSGSIALHYIYFR